MKNFLPPIGLCAALALALACASTRGLPDDGARAIRAQTEIPDELLLDVGIEPFDPGLPDEAEEASEEDLVFPEVRKAESRFLPFQLKRTLQHTGQWGAVWLTPAETRTADVTVTGAILASDGEVLKLRIAVTDASGRTWFEQEYESTVDERAYAPPPGEEQEPFQDVYNRIANDMLRARSRLDTSEIRKIRAIAWLDFAAALAPVAFGNHLHSTPDGTVTVKRLPADDDPMLARIERIRERDDMLMDTLNEHYAEFYLGMGEPYRQWRQYSYEELAALRKLKRDANLRLIAGAASIIGGMVLASVGAPLPLELLAGPLVIGGTLGFRSGWELRAESQIHAEAVRELGRSFEADVAPRVVEVEGRTLKLTGSAEAQYAEWRQLLRKIYAAETGLPVPEGAGAAPPATDATWN